MTTPNPDLQGASTGAMAEQDRLTEIAALDLFADDVAASLQDVVDAAARQLDVPIVLVSIVLDDAQQFIASHGLGGWLAHTQGTPVEWSFCANAVASGAPFIVEDATTHPSVCENPLVTVDGVRCYAGIPLRTSRGHVLGTLCVIGTEERTFTEAEVATLSALADEIMERLEARRQT